jgi:hypothetical protein
MLRCRAFAVNGLDGMPITFRVGADQSFAPDPNCSRQAQPSSDRNGFVAIGGGEIADRELPIAGEVRLVPEFRQCPPDGLWVPYGIRAKAKPSVRAACLPDVGWNSCNGPESVPA